jgi:hypothetical protein
MATVPTVTVGTVSPPLAISRTAAAPLGSSQMLTSRTEIPARRSLKRSRKQ